MSKVKLHKLNQDDLLEILTEFLAEGDGYGTFSSRAIIIGTPDVDLRAIVAVGDLGDENIKDISLEEIDRTMDFNGSHANTKGMSKEDFLKIKFDDF